MESFYKKVRLIFVPYLILLFLSLTAYSFCNWRLYLLRPSAHVWEGMMLVIAPIAVAAIAVLIWLRPRLRLLTIIPVKGSPQFSLNILSIMGVAIPIILFQHLLLSATADLRKVNVPSDIAKAGYAKYYSVKEFAELKKHVFMRFATTTTNKGRTLVHRQYFSMPLIDKGVFANDHFAEDTAGTFMKLFIEGDFPQVWACRAYTMKIKKKANTRAKEDKFIEESKNDFYGKGFSEAIYLDRLGNNKLRDEYRRTIIKEGGQRELIILDAKFTPFERRNDRMLIWTIAGTLLSSGALLLIFAIFKWDEERLQAFDKERIW